MVQSIDPKDFIMAIGHLAEDKNLPEEVVQDAIEHAIASAYRKDYEGKDTEVRATINPKKGEYKLYVTKTVVDEVEDEETEISLEEAKRYDKDAKVDEELEYQVKIDEFGRVAAQTAKQVILQKLREAEREIIQEEYKDKIGEVLNGIVQRVERRIVNVDIGRATGILPYSEQIQNERLNPGQRIKVYLKDVEASNRGPQVILSRAVPEFIVHLFEQEVPEMSNDSVAIRAIAREAGVRTKLAVASNVPGVDPVGTFVGGHGTRVQAVMSEIGDQEKIDIIMYDEDVVQFIKNALAPTEVTDVELDEENDKAVVKVPEDQLSIAIGKQGQNVRLASKLTGYQLDIVQADGGSDTESEEEKKEETKKPKKKKSGRKDIEGSLLSAIEETGDEEGSESSDEDSSEEE